MFLHVHSWEVAFFLVQGPTCQQAVKKDDVVKLESATGAGLALLHRLYSGMKDGAVTEDCLLGLRNGFWDLKSPLNELHGDFLFYTNWV